MFARTERLLLRPGWEDDAVALHDAIAHEAVAMKLSHLPWPYTLDDAQSFLAAQRQREARHMLIFARTAGKPRLIGGISLDTVGSSAELGYWISPPYWGLGFATEAARAVVHMARASLPCRKVVAHHFVDNPASGNVLRKLGFQRSNRLIARPCLARGMDVPSLDYELAFAEQGDCPDDNMARDTLLAA
jgi:RimJ/RimL family protein N-acetyltransferase